MVTHQQHQGAASHHLVELVTVAYQKTAAIRGGMHGLVEKLDTGEGLATEAAEEFIVVTGHIDNAGAGGGQLQQFVNNLPMTFRKVGPALHGNQVDDRSEERRVGKECRSR